MCQLLHIQYVVVLTYEEKEFDNDLDPAVLGKLLFKSNLSMSTITWLEK